MRSFAVVHVGIPALAWACCLAGCVDHKAVGQIMLASVSCWTAALSVSEAGFGVLDAHGGCCHVPGCCSWAWHECDTLCICYCPRV